MPWLFLLVLHFTGRTDALPLTDRTGPPAVSSTSIAVDAPLDTVGAALASLKERAARLASQMSLEEKISQLSTNSPAIPHLNISEFDWWQGVALSSHSMTNCFGPNINTLRDPRWGRGSETYGEDPALTSRMAQAFVTGLQGTDGRYLKVGATCKHLAAYSLEEWEGISRFSFDARTDPRDLQDTYLPAFKACVEGGAHSVMCSYNSLEGTPACASRHLLEGTLRRQLGFDGFVVSDCGAVDSIWQHHRFTNSSTAAAGAALRAGTDVACLDYSALLGAVQEGRVEEGEVEQAVRRVLLARLRLGHLDPPEGNPYSRIPPSAIGHPRHLALAREAAAKSIVLLKNQRPGGGGNGEEEEGEGEGRHPPPKTLPLNPGALQKVTVVGPLANRSEYLLGNYYGQPWGEVVTPLQAIQEYLGGRPLPHSVAEPRVEYVLGAEVVGTGAFGVEDVVASCRTSQACIFFLGSSMVEEGVQMEEGAGSFPLVPVAVEGEGHDRRSLLLPGSQLDLVQAAAKRTSTPLVVVLLHGGPLDVAWLQGSRRVGAILTGWFPGQGAAALADVLFGEVSPSGRLPVTFYHQNYTSQVAMGDMRMRPWPGRTHRFLQVPPLYPFGHGLSYTNFTYANLTLSLETSPCGGADVAALHTSLSAGWPHLHLAAPHGVGRGGTARPGGGWERSWGRVALRQERSVHSRGEGSGGVGEGDAAGLRVSVEVRNAGRMAGEEVVLAFLSYCPPDGVGGWPQSAGCGKSQQAQQDGSMGQRGGNAAQVMHVVPCDPPSQAQRLLMPSDEVPRQHEGGGVERGVLTPMQTLAAFRRVSLPPGHASTVHISIAAAELAAASSGALPLSSQGQQEGGPGDDSGSSRGALLHAQARVACGMYTLRVGELRHSFLLTHLAGAPGETA